MVELQFIDYESPEQAKGAVKKRAVKSQAARHHWARDAASRASRPGSASASESRGRGRGRGRAQVFDVLVRGDSETSTSIECANGHAEGNKNIPNGHTEGNGIPVQTGGRPLDLLGAGRVDPFDTYPVAWQSFFPKIVDHYIIHLADDIPEIDGPDNKGLLRTRWFPLVMTEPATFLSILLLSASHLYSVQKTPNVAVDLLRLKEQAIRAVNEGLADPSRSYGDAMVGAVAKMCSYEAMYGNMDSYMVHMHGLQSMVSVRGGLSGLGLGGMLQRICLWIDLNSAFLNNTPRFFDGSLSAEPNPGQFVGSLDMDEFKDEDSAEGSTSR